jgi:hypothetical protein
MLAMVNNVMSWNQGLRSGHNPSEYPFIATLVPTGHFVVKLDFKIWAKKAMGICCYFTDQRSGRKFQLTVYRRKSDERYMLDGCEIDFSTCEIDEYYSVLVSVNERGNISFVHACEYLMRCQNHKV